MWKFYEINNDKQQIRKAYLRFLLRWAKMLKLLFTTYSTLDKKP